MDRTFDCSFVIKISKYSLGLKNVCFSSSYDNDLQATP